MTRTSQEHCLNCADEPERCYRTDVEREKPIFYKVSEIPLEVLEGVNRPLLPDELEEMMNMSAMHAAEEEPEVPHLLVIPVARRSSGEDGLTMANILQSTLISGLNYQNVCNNSVDQASAGIEECM